MGDGFWTNINNWNFISQFNNLDRYLDNSTGIVSSCHGLSGNLGFVMSTGLEKLPQGCFSSKDHSVVFLQSQMWNKVSIAKQPFLCRDSFDSLFEKPKATKHFLTDVPHYPGALSSIRKKLTFQPVFLIFGIKSSKHFMAFFYATRGNFAHSSRWVQWWQPFYFPLRRWQYLALGVRSGIRTHAHNCGPVSGDKNSTNLQLIVS